MADPARLKFEQICPDCQGRDFVEDHAQGDLICKVSHNIESRKLIAS